MREKDSPAAHRAPALLLEGAFLLACLGALAGMWRLVENSALAGDESQHMLIAWQVSQGAVLYRDFHEHHGPLYPLFNAGLIHALDLGRGFETVMALRRVSLALAAGCLALVWAIGRRMSGAGLVGAVAAATLSWTWYFQTKITELRPDGLQSLLTLASVLLLLRAARSATDGAGRRWLLLAGLAMGGALAANAKAGVSAAAVVLGWLALAPITGRARRRVVTEAALYTAAALAALAPFGLYFLWQGALADAVYSNLDFNLLLAAGKQGLHTRYNRFMLEEQTLFVLAAAAGVAALGWRALRGERRRPERVLVFSLAALSSAVVGAMMFKLHPHQYLACLPWLSLAIADGAVGASSRVPARWRPLAASAVGAAVVASLVRVSAPRLPDTPSANLEAQRALTDFVVETTGPDEPILALGYSCSGFMFNPPAHYFWSYDMSMVGVFRRHYGQAMYGETTRRILEEVAPPYVLAVSERKSAFTRRTLDTLRRDYKRTDRRGCIWTRRPGAG